MAQLIVTCECGQQMRMPGNALGKMGTCVACGKHIKITTENTVTYHPQPLDEAEKRELFQKQEAAAAEWEDPYPQHEVAKNPNGILGAISFLIPFVGLIIGIVFVMKNRAEDKRTGRICLIACLIGFVIGVIFIAGCPLMFLGTLPDFAPETDGVFLPPQEPLIRQPALPQTPITLSGYGQQATRSFQLSRGLRRFRLTHDGSGFFGVRLLDANGNKLELLAAETEPCSISKAARVDTTGSYVLDISADGSWTVHIQ